MMAAIVVFITLNALLTGLKTDGIITAATMRLANVSTTTDTWAYLITQRRTHPPPSLRYLRTVAIMLVIDGLSMYDPKHPPTRSPVKKPGNVPT
jgi:hypothetical protein